MAVRKAWNPAVRAAFKVKFRAPSFAHLQAMEALSAKRMLADVLAIIGSLDIVFGEIDR
jgi:NADH-quinone oxidoreductase subunit D